MRKLVKREIADPHRLERHDENIAKQRRDDQVGQRSRFKAEFWENLQSDLKDAGRNRMPAGAQHLLANAIVNWASNYLEQY